MDPDYTGAIISPCGQYRHTLYRNWDTLTGAGYVLWVMLNPSTADAEKDDNTIRRCIGFSQRWGYAGLKVGNLYNFRTKDPAALRKAGFPVTGENDTHLEDMAARASLIVAAWGGHAQDSRARAVLKVLTGWGNVQCLGRTKAGKPKHPLYLDNDTPLELLQGRGFRP